MEIDVELTMRKACFLTLSTNNSHAVDRKVHKITILCTSSLFSHPHLADL